MREQNARTGAIISCFGDVICLPLLRTANAILLYLPEKNEKISKEFYPMALNLYIKKWGDLL